MGGLNGANWSVRPAPPWLNVLGAPATRDRMAEATPLGRNDAISLRMALMVGCASDAANEAALPDEPLLGTWRVGVAGVPAAKVCGVEAPGNCDAMAEARLLGRKAMMFCSMALMMGCANSDPIVAAVTVDVGAVEVLPLTRRLIGCWMMDAVL